MSAPDLLVLRDAATWRQRWADEAYLDAVATGDDRPGGEFESGWWFEAQAPRPDWQMPPPPFPGATPTAEHYGGGWHLYWAPHTGHNAAIPWPFAEDEAAQPAQLVALGFVIAEGGEE